MGVQVHQQGHLDAAEEIYRRVLNEFPNHIDALHYSGVLKHSRGDSLGAIALIRKALALNPDYIDARINLGNVFKELQRYREAETEYRAAIVIDPQQGNAHNNLGTVLRAQRKTVDAIRSFEKATELSPNSADAFQNLGNALKANQQIEESLTAYRQAIEIDPRHCDAHLALGRALYRFGRIDEAKVVYEKWLEIEPENAIAKHMMIACGGEKIPDRCSDEFVRDSFDSFADSFDEVLERLDYRAPEFVAHCVAKEFAGESGSLDILDMGCGTGLCGSLLRKYARDLVGIDLSPKMIDKAKGLNLYDDLLVAELTTHLSQNPNQYDLIVAADTLVYIGALQDVFFAANNALRPNGAMVFTVEYLRQESSKGFQLHPHGRYSHTESYLRRGLDLAGFTIRSMEKEILRNEVNAPVEGLVVTVRRA